MHGRFNRVRAGDKTQLQVGDEEGGISECRYGLFCVSKEGRWERVTSADGAYCVQGGATVVTEVEKARSVRVMLPGTRLVIVEPGS